MQADRTQPWADDWAHLDFAAAARRLAGSVLTTPIVELPSPDPGLRVRAKLENRQVGKAFKARGAWNHLSQWSSEERAAGVVAASSGNHGLALAWAAQRLGIPCTLCMPAITYESKIAGCRAHGADVQLFPTRDEAEAACDALAARGAQRVHGYDADRTIEGAGTVGWEIAQQCEPVDLVLLPVGGGGLSSGTSLALRRAWGRGPQIWAVEPEGAAGMTLGLRAGHSVPLPKVESRIQGLTSPFAGERCIAINAQTLDGVFTLPDERFEAAAERLLAAGEVVEPAGAAGYAALWQADAPWRESARSRTAADPFEVLVVISGGNRPDVGAESADPSSVERNSRHSKR